MLDQIPQSLDNTAGSQAFSGRGQRVWIDLETGQQVKYQIFWQLQDGTEMIDFTRRVLLIESVNTPLDEVLQTLDKVITP